MKTLQTFGNAFLVDILTDEQNACHRSFDKDKAMKRHYTCKKHGIWHPGGHGYLYKYTTNPEVTTGDGCAAAVRCGAKVVDMELVQSSSYGSALS